MNIEQTIIDKIEAHVKSITEFQGRVQQSAVFPIDLKEYPCARIRMPDVTVSTQEAGRPGMRPQTRSGMVVISVIHDGRYDGVDLVQREITDHIEAALLADPYLTTDGKPLVSDLKIAGSHADPVSNRGSVVAVRQLMVSVVWRTRETNPGALMHA